MHASAGLGEVGADVKAGYAEKSYGSEALTRRLDRLEGVADKASQRFNELEQQHSSLLQRYRSLQQPAYVGAAITTAVTKAAISKWYIFANS